MPEYPKELTEITAETRLLVAGGKFVTAEALLAWLKAKLELDEGSE